MGERPLILVTNDDGVDAAGIDVLARAFEALGEVLVVAPAVEQSAIGHGITLGQPLRVHSKGKRRFAVTGKPADAVFLGVSVLSEREPSLVVSGINHGPNLGVDVLYSGTVAAATEAAMRGIPALAVSQLLPVSSGEGANGVDPAGRGVDATLAEVMGPTAEFAARVGSEMLRGCPPRVVINLNAPAIRNGGWRWTRLSRQSYLPTPERRVDPRGVEYYWIKGVRLDGDEGPGTDVDALRRGDYSLTVLGLDRSLDPPEEAKAWRLGELPASS